MFRYIFSIAAIIMAALVMVMGIQRQSPTSTKWLAFTASPDGNLYRIHAVNQRPIKVSDQRFDRPSLSPDGRRMVFLQPTETGLMLMRTSTSDLDKREVLWNGDGIPTYISWSPDNKWIAFVWSHGIETSLSIIKFDGSGYQQVSSDPVSSSQPVWSPDSEWLYYAASGSTDAVILRTNIYTTETETFLRSASEPALSPDGRRLAYVAHSGPQKFVTIVDVETHDRLTQMPFFSLSPFWSEDGSNVYFSDFRDGNLWRYDLDIHQGQQLTFGSNGKIYARLLDGDCLIAEEVTQVSMTWEIELLKVCGQSTTLLTPQFDLVHSPLWLPHTDELWHPLPLSLGAFGLGVAGLLLRRR